MTSDVRIKGPSLNNKQIEVINLLKSFEKDVLDTLELLKEQEEFSIDKDWIEIGTRDLQKSFMSIVKGVAVESK